MCCRTSLFLFRNLPLLAELRHEAVEVLLAPLQGLPGRRPEAKVDRPVLDRTGTASLHKCRHDRVELQHAFAEWRMVAGFATVEPAVGIDQMDMDNVAAEHP